MNKNEYYYSNLIREVLKYICDFNFLEITHLGYSTLKGTGITIEYPEKNIEFVIEILDHGRLLITILQNDDMLNFLQFNIESESSALNKIKETMKLYFN